MSWTKQFRHVNINNRSYSADKSDKSIAGFSTSANYSSFLPDIYAGHPNRVQRYYQYDDMDRDSDINAALDTIADFCTQSEEQNDEPFIFNFAIEPNETELKLLKETLTRWVKINSFKQRLWRIFRNTVKNGDAFFLRDPENGQWLWLDHYTIELVMMREDGSKRPDAYLVRNLDISLGAKFASSAADVSQFSNPYGGSGSPGTNQMTNGSTGNPAMFQMAGADRDPRNQQGRRNTETSAVDAAHVIHLSLSEGMDVNWPFGASVLEPVYKTFRQKEMLEDAVIIYRIQRAPERRVFKIDVGTMSPQRARAHIEAVKNEIHQRRIPNRSGGGQSLVDAAYNPLSIVEDYFLAQTADGRGSSIETLPGGDSLGEVGDLVHFNQKLSRGLRIPPSYLSFGDDSGVSYNDGKLGAALIQEFRFNKYCMRLQNQLAPVFDADFKWYLRQQGIDILPSMFELQFNPPQNFTKYRQMEIDAQQISVYSQISDNRKLSERFKFERFLNLSPDEMVRNEMLWREENPSKVKKAAGATQAETDAPDDLSSVGVRPPTDGFGFENDFSDMGGDDFSAPADTGEDMGGDSGGAGAAPIINPEI